MAEKVQFTNSQMLKWMEYVADMQGVSAERLRCLTLAAREEMCWQLLQHIREF